MTFLKVLACVCVILLGLYIGGLLAAGFMIIATFVILATRRANSVKRERDNR